MTRAAAIVVTYNSADDIEECLRGISGCADVAVRVVDSGSSDRTVEIAEAIEGVEVDAAGENIGWTAATNRALAGIDSEFVAFVNPDARPTADQILALADRFDEHTGAVAPRYLNSDGSPQSFYFRFPRPLTGPFLYLNSGQRLDARLGRPIIRHTLYQDRPPIDRIDHAGAACLVLRTAVVRELGGLDERMWLLFSDTDLSMRLHRAGLAVRIADDVRVVHAGGTSLGRQSMDWQQLVAQRDYLAFARKWYSRPGRWITYLGIGLFSGVVPAFFSLARREPSRARFCLQRAYRVLADR
jgi:GT2 family glycosyltransferase